MNHAASITDIFAHVRGMVAIVLGLSISRLVTGLTRFVQHPKLYRIYPVHIGWVLFLLLNILHFWWYEYALIDVPVWTFAIYLFVVLYAIIFVVLASLLFPDHLNEYSSYEEYFESRRKWFYGFLTLMFVVDVLDTAIKGRDYLLSFGGEYLIRQGVLAAFSFLLIFVQARRFQKLFVFLALLYQLVWIFRMFEIIR
jgi:hypothetical protein